MGPGLVASRSGELSSAKPGKSLYLIQSLCYTNGATASELLVDQLQ